MANINSLQTIGSKTLVDFPQYDLRGIPAKVDTGADLSSIWASDIREKSGTLSFALFNKNSRFYTGKLIKTKDYTITSIKNSFGNSELRHKVRLSVTVNGKQIRARFTLADRSKNHYPILIGRRTLHGKFLVDVTQDHSKGKHEVLVLSANPDKDKNKFFKEVGKILKNADFTLCSYDDLDFYIHQGSCQIKLAKNGRDIDSFDLVFFKDYLRSHEISVAIAHYLDKREIPFFDESALDYSLNNKLFQYIVLADNNISVPDSIFKSTDRLKKSYKSLSDKLGMPFILKDIYGLRGRNNYIIKDKKAFDKAFVKLDPSVAYIAQKFIPTDEYYRMLILGKHIKMVIKKRRKAVAKHFNSEFSGPQPKLLDQNVFPFSVKQQSINAAVLMKRNVAGVDWVEDKETNSWYCLEVNASPQLASGIYQPEKRQVFAEYIDNLISK